MMDGSAKIIVIKKKKVKGGAHHGGSWKVAYADFVTAMMAFFLVMWIMGMDQGVKDLVQGYFTNPVGIRQSFSGGTNPISAGNSPVDLELRTTTLLLSREAQKGRFEEVAEELEQQFEERLRSLDLQAEIEAVVTDEGLRIELMETGGESVLFGVASAQPRPSLERLLDLVAEQLRPMQSFVVVEGHTDARPFRTSSGYSNWELSVDRANMARRMLESRGLEHGRFSEVRGYAERAPKILEDPLDPRNRRITILLPFNEPIDLSDGSRVLADSVGGATTVVPGGSHGS